MPKFLQQLAAVTLMTGMAASSAWAAGVQIQGNTDINTNVQGNVKQSVTGKGNKATTNIGGVQGDVKLQGNTKLNTNVKGNVVNVVGGKNKEGQVRIGGISSE